jgi:hypothetical protein
MEPLDLQVKKLSYVKEGGYEMILSSPLFGALVDSMLEVLRRTGPNNGNFITTTLANIEGTVSVTIQREGGKTPAEKIAYLKDRILFYRMMLESKYGMTLPKEPDDKGSDQASSPN